MGLAAEASDDAISATVFEMPKEEVLGMEYRLTSGLTGKRSAD